MKTYAFFALMTAFTLFTFYTVSQENPFGEMLLGAWLVFVTSAQEKFLSSESKKGKSDNEIEMEEMKVD